MSGHTKGPWETGVTQSLMSDIFSDGDYNIYPPMGEAGPVAIAAGIGNARLIAAAPELLEALMNARGVLQAFATQSQTAALCEEMARAAIAKATGQPPSLGAVDGGS